MIEKPKFKKGDFVFSEFKLKQIMEMEGDRITDVSDGNFRTGSSDLSDVCFPLTLRIKCISDGFAYWKNKLSEVPNSRALNMPDINRELVNKWVVTCEDSDDDELLKANYQDVRDFCQNIIDKAEGLSNVESHGVSIFK